MDFRETSFVMVVLCALCARTFGQGNSTSGQTTNPAKNSVSGVLVAVIVVSILGLAMFVAVFARLKMKNSRLACILHNTLYRIIIVAARWN